MDVIHFQQCVHEMLWTEAVATAITELYADAFPQFVWNLIAGHGCPFMAMAPAEALGELLRQCLAPCATIPLDKDASVQITRFARRA